MTSRSVLFGFPPYLSWLIQYSLPDRPSLLLLHSARCQKQGRLSLLCVPPPFLCRIPAFHLSLPSLPKITQRVAACRGEGERKRRDRDGRKGGRLVLTALTLRAIKSLHNIGRIILKAVQSSLLHSPHLPPPSLFENAFAHQSMTRLSFLDLLLIISAGLNLDWCDSLSVMSLSLSAINAAFIFSPSKIGSWQRRFLKADHSHIPPYGLCSALCRSGDCSLPLSDEQ